MTTATQIKISNLADYVEECKGIIDRPTRRLLINEVAGALIKENAELSHETAMDNATLFIDACIRNSLEISSTLKQQKIHNNQG